MHDFEKIYLRDRRARARLEIHQEMAGSDRSALGFDGNIMGGSHHLCPGRHLGICAIGLMDRYCSQGKDPFVCVA
jgi:hypothetical protein